MARTARLVADQKVNVHHLYRKAEGITSTSKVSTFRRSSPSSLGISPGGQIRQTDPLPNADRQSADSFAYPNLSSSSPLASTMMPSSVMVKPRARSASRFQPISNPLGIRTSLSTMARRIRARRPTSTPSNRIASSIRAKLLIRTPGETMLR